MQTFKPKINWGKAEIAEQATVRTTKREPPTHSPHIARIILLARRMAAKMQLPAGDEIHYALNKTNVAQQWAEAQYKQEGGERGRIPTQYEDFKEVFSEEAAKRFPPEREDDHAVELLPDAPKTFFCKIYPISAQETTFLREWVKENLDK